MVSPHGMLEPWALQNSRWKKRLAGWLFEIRNLQTADCLHALCNSEAESFRKYGLRNPIAIIPNGIELPTSAKLQNYREKQDFLRANPHLEGRSLLLFLSRIHPKKGLADLLRAWARVGAQDRYWSLLVVGPNELNHETRLRSMAAELGIDRHVHFLGPAYGPQKTQVLSVADAFVLPSFSEGFSMSVLEAAALGLPVLLTRECNFSELAAAQAAIEVPAGISGITEGLKKLLQLNEEQRILMGAKGVELVKRAYSWPTIAREMVRVYDWLTKTGPQPDCIWNR
jgi:poly(glycerol-phosphate) alpha-glucosyltransferase